MDTGSPESSGGRDTDFLDHTALTVSIGLAGRFTLQEQRHPPFLTRQEDLDKERFYLFLAFEMWVHWWTIHVNSVHGIESYQYRGMVWRVCSA